VYGHQGGRYDATSSLYSFRHREFSPRLGRWAQQDPIGLDAGDNNLYRYVNNNPVVYGDVLGLFRVQNGTIDIDWKEPGEHPRQPGLFGPPVTITFKGDPAKCKCNEIRFIQTNKIVLPDGSILPPSAGKGIETKENKDKKIEGGWAVDMDPSIWRPGTLPTPFYDPNFPNIINTNRICFGGLNIPAKMGDHPAIVPNHFGAKFYFESCAICGADSKVLGCITWGFQITGKNTVEKFPSQASDAPSPTFIEALKQMDLYYKAVNACIRLLPWGGRPFVR
jgi:RHS repeat-associated protein